MSCFCDKFLTMVPAITFQTAFISLYWHKSKLLLISLLSGLKPGWATSEVKIIWVHLYGSRPYSNSIQLSILVVGGLQTTEAVATSAASGFSPSHQGQERLMYAWKNLEQEQSSEKVLPHSSNKNICSSLVFLYYKPRW